MTTKAIVLLSGLDSAAAMHWAIDRYGTGNVAALSIAYGQPHKDSEIAASGAIAKRRDVPWRMLAVADAVRGTTTLSAPTPGIDHGVSRANIAGRNLILISIAGAEAARLWPNRASRVVIGANEDDAASFPDCRRGFMRQASEALLYGLAGVADVRLDTPWLDLGFGKADIIGWCAKRQEALDDARDSVSCYVGTRCGACDACVLRSSSFAAVGVSDGTWLPTICGGDPHREKV